MEETVVAVRISPLGACLPLIRRWRLRLGQYRITVHIYRTVRGT